ncbi:MAG: hypothetical protein K8S99_16180 [Planctomycetes bacterium]|nr:hypothetical protein [Planctomycetota bacterium]
MSTRYRWLAAWVIVLVSAPAWAEDAYFSVVLNQSEMTVVETRPAGEPENRARWSMMGGSACYTVLDGEGEAYVDSAMAQANWNPDAAVTGTLTARAPAGKDVTGRLFFPGRSSGAVILKFTIPAGRAAAEAKQIFLTHKLEHYRELSGRGYAGAAWFRHQANEAARELSGHGESPAAAGGMRRPRMDDPEDLYDLFSGGRAVSENLQLDRALLVRPATRPSTQPADPLVDTNSLTGITVQEMDWAALLKGAKPEFDPLASLVPVDQHAVFFPSFASAMAIADEAGAGGTPGLHLALPLAEETHLVKRYERQLGLSMSTLGRLLGPELIKSVALTGSDPYYLTGTDVAVLFEAANPAALQTLLVAQITLASQSPSTEFVKAELSGVKYVGARSPDRAVSSYVATLGNAVVVTNSLAQLERLVNVSRNGSPSLATAPEYVFFRNRYPRADNEESALIVLSDAAIRRWCGPRWRIGSARRTVALAALAELQARQLDVLAKDAPPAIHVDAAGSAVDLGDVSLAPGGVRSSIYGSMGFQTPISELDLAKVTKAEAESYQRWRDTYQQNWRQSFDPIALRLSVKTNKLAADLTVTPLIASTEYREFIELTKGATIAPTAGDPHPDLLHAVMAIDAKSRMAQRGGMFAVTAAPGINIDPLGWLGQSIAIYVDEGPLWQEAAKLPPEKRSGFIEQQLHRLPVAFRAEVADGFKLTAFLTALRGWVEQTSPGMTVWETLKHNEQPYVKVSQAGEARPGENRLAIYYAASADALLLSPSEELIKRALDRRAARAALAKPGAPAVAATQAAAVQAPPVAKPWLGSQLCFRVNGNGINLLSGMAGEGYQEAMRTAAWSNIPILNEWHRRYPGQDPVALHEKFWLTRLVCPGGGTYAWNDAWQTMESTVYGHPGQPKDGPAAALPIAAFEQSDMGLTFENNGLRARIELDRTPPKPATPK